MKKTKYLLYSVLLLLILSLGFTGCNAVLGLVFKPDLTVLEVEPLMDDSGELSGVRIVFANLGIVDAEPVTYAAVLSGDETVSLVLDTTVWEDTITLEAGEEVQVDLSGEQHVNPWMISHDVMDDLEGGTYFLGAVIDIDNDVEEKDELNNEMSSNTSFEMGGDGGGEDGGTVTVELSGANDLDGYSLMYGVFELSALPESGGNPVASGIGQISNGSAWVTALAIVNTDPLEAEGTWYGNLGETYAIYMMVDMNGNSEHDRYIDYSYGGELNILINDAAEVVAVARGDLGGRGDPQPVPSGVYSESHDIYVQPDFWGERVILSLTSVEQTTYDGSVSLKADFNDTPDPRWIHVDYPSDPTPVMNISDATNLVFAVESTDLPGLTSFAVLLWSPGSSADVVTVTIDGPPYYSHSDADWDVYSIPIGDFVAATSPAFDPAELTGMSIGAPNVAGAFFFDDIHFE